MRPVRSAVGCVERLRNPSPAAGRFRIAREEHQGIYARLRGLSGRLRPSSRAIRAFTPVFAGYQGVYARLRGLWRERPYELDPSYKIDVHEMNDQDLEAIRTPVHLLENATLAARLTNILGKPIELIGLALPEGASKVIAAATTQGLNAALKVALRTMENRPEA